MSAFLWVFVVLNLVLGCYNSFVSGAIWNRTEGWYQKALAASGLFAGFVGVGYAFVLTGVGLGFASTDLILATNVFIGIPMIVLGIMFAYDAWMHYRETGSKMAAIAAVWNTAATFWNIAIYIRSFKEVGGFSGAAKEVAENGAAVIAAAAILSAIISYAMFKLGGRVVEE